MIPLAPFPGGLLDLGRGEAAERDRSLFDARLSTAVRYADPASWVTATAVGRAALGLKAELSAARDGVAVVGASEQGAQATLAAVAQAAREGYSSPLRYPAANPGAIVGVACIAFGFRGPTLNLLQAPEDAAPLALFMASRWLSRGAARYVVAAVCRHSGPERCLARAIVLGPRLATEPREPPASDAVAWLAGAPRESPAR
jgi:hypothetical protein